MIKEVVLSNAFFTACYFVTLDVVKRKFPKEQSQGKLSLNLVEFVVMCFITLGALILGGEKFYNPQKWHLPYDSSIHLVFIKIVLGWFIWHLIGLRLLNINMLQTHHAMIIILAGNAIYSHKYHGYGFFFIMGTSTAIQRTLIYLGKKNYLKVNQKLLGWQYVGINLMVAVGTCVFVVTEIFIRKTDPMTFPAGATALPVVSFSSMYYAYNEAVLRFSKQKQQDPNQLRLIQLMYGSVVLGITITCVQAYSNIAMDITKEGFLSVANRSTVDATLMQPRIEL